MITAPAAGGSSLLRRLKNCPAQYLLDIGVLSLRVLRRLFWENWEKDRHGQRIAVSNRLRNGCGPADCRVVSLGSCDFCVASRWR